MLELLPTLLLIAMIAITLILLPRLHDDRQRPPERTGRTDELHIKPPRDS